MDNLSWVTTPTPTVEIPCAEYADLLANVEKNTFWKGVAITREDCYTRMVRAELTRDQNLQDFDDAFEELQASEKKVLALEASRDEWMSLGRDAHNDSKRFVAQANTTMVARNRALWQRNAALFAASLLGGWTVGYHALFAMGAL